MRKDWARRMGELSVPGTGLLITMQHPLDKSHIPDSPKDGGPPFLLSPELYVSKWV